MANSDVWFVTERLPADAELLYQFFVNPPESDQNAVAWARSARPDPLNPLGYPDKSDPMFDAAQPWRNGSIARMPAVPANPWVAKQSGVAAGTLDEHSVQSAALTMGNPRAVWVYRTPGPMPPNPNVLVLCDGGTTYQNRIPTRTILDNLYAAKKIGPTVALFVDNGGPARNVDGNFSDLYVRFLADELLPWAQRQFGFKARAAHTVFGGDSICGLIGAYAALKRSDVFGGVLAQSGAFQFNNSHDASDAREPEWLARYVARSPKAPVTFYMEVGQVENRPEGNDGTSLLAANRHLRDVLRAKGYDVRYTEVFGDHDPVHWTRTLPDALTAMLGPTARQDQPRNFRSGAQ